MNNQKKTSLSSSDEEDNPRLNAKNPILEMPNNKKLIHSQFLPFQQQKKSSYSQLYRAHFIDIEQPSLEEIGKKYKNKLKDHNIEFIPNKFQQNVGINRIDSTISSQIVTYHVRLSYFRLYITLLNLDFALITDEGMQFLGGGSYGNIYSMNVFGKEYACKNVMYEQAQNQVGDQEQKVYSTLIQYSISKICSALQVGLNIEACLGFDLICYTNCIQFFMEYAQKVTVISEVEKIQLLKNLSLIHTIKLIHNDIKPENIMLSPMLGYCVLIDYGISEFVSQPIGTLSQVAYRGSYNYSLTQMKLLFHDRLAGLVDLYFNDLNALLITFKQMVCQNNINQLKNIYYQNYQPIEVQILLKQKENILTNSVNTIVKFILTIYTLFTQKSPLGLSLEQIFQSNRFPQKIYLELADIMTELFPNPFLYDFFKKHICSFLIQRNLNHHPLFSIYKETHFVPWLKEDIIKQRKFQARLCAVQTLMNYHLIILSKPATIDKFFSGFNQTTKWEQRNGYYICYLDFMDRNCKKSNQYLVQLVFKLINKNKQKVAYDSQLQKNLNLQIKSSKQPNIQLMHYQILCYIYQSFSRKEIVFTEDFWIVCKLMQMFQKLSDYKKVIYLFNFIITQPISNSNKAQLFNYAYDIFSMLQKYYNPLFIPQIQKKIRQMYGIRQLIQKENPSTQQKYNLFFTKILIKIAQFIFLVSKLSSQKQKSRKIELFESMVKQILLLWQGHASFEKTIEISRLRIKIIESQFLLSYLKNDYHSLVKYGQEIIQVNNTIANPHSSKYLSREIANAMAQGYFEIGDIQKAKKFLHRNLNLQIQKSFYSQFNSMLVRFKINILQGNLNEAKNNLFELKAQSKQFQNEILLINSLTTFYLRFRDSIPNRQSEFFILSQLECFFLKIDQYPLKMQQNIHIFNILNYLSNLYTLNTNIIRQELIKYRKIAAKTTIEELKKSQTFLQSQRSKIQDSIEQLNYFIQNAENLQYFPDQKCCSFLPQLFFTIHLKYYQIYLDNEKVLGVYQRSMKLFPFDRNLVSLQLWINWYRFLFKRIHIFNQQNIKAQLQLLLNFIFQTNRQIVLMKKKWYDVFFAISLLSSNKQNKYQLPIKLIIKLAQFVNKSQCPSFLQHYQDICKQFCLHITHKADIDYLLDKNQQFREIIKELPEILIFLYLIYTKVLVSKFKEIENYDQILRLILTAYFKMNKKTKILLEKNIYFFLFQRFNHCVKKLPEVSNFTKIEVIGKDFTFAKIYQTKRYYLRKHFRNPYSDEYFHKFKMKQLFPNIYFYSHSQFQQHNSTQNQTNRKLKYKLYQYMKNKQIQYGLFYN